MRAYVWLSRLEVRNAEFWIVGHGAVAHTADDARQILSANFPDVSDADPSYIFDIGSFERGQRVEFSARVFDATPPKATVVPV